MDLIVLVYLLELKTVINLLMDVVQMEGPIETKLTIIVDVSIPNLDVVKTVLLSK